MSRIVLEDLAVCKLVNGVVDDQPWLSSVSCDTARLGNQAEVESPGSPAQKAPGKSHITCWTRQLDLGLIVDVKMQDILRCEHLVQISSVSIPSMITRLKME